MNRKENVYNLKAYRIIEKFESSGEENFVIKNKKKGEVLKFNKSDEKIKDVLRRG